MVYCCVPFCTSSSSRKLKEKHISFHEFPSNSELREEWLKAISRKDFEVNFSSRSTVVCSKHFSPDNFFPDRKIKMLKKGAVPTIFKDYPTYKIPKAPCYRRNIIKQDIAMSSTHKRKQVNDNSAPGKKLKPNNLPIISEAEKQSFSSVADAELLIHFSNSVLNSAIVSPTKKPIQLQNTIKSKIQKEVRLIKSTLWKKNQLLMKQKTQIKEMQKLLKYYEESKHHAAMEKIAILADTGNRRANFLLHQIENFFNKKPRWDELTIRECVLWNTSSPKSYTLIRQRRLLLLPSKMTLCRYVGPVSGEFGVTTLIKQRLQQESKNLNEPEKFASLVIDEMAIKPQLIFDKQLDRFFGEKNVNVESGALNQQQPLANRLLCFILCGLSTRYRIPCSYFFSRQLTGKDLHKLTLRVIEEVENCGFVIVRIVTDNHKTNVAMFRILGGGKLIHNIPHPFDDQRVLFLSFDQNHIIKNVRSLFLEKKMTDGKDIISGEYVKLLYKLQQRENVKAVRNLTYRHIEPTNLDKMNVRRAVLIFSPPVTAALKFLSHHSTRHSKAHQFVDAGATIMFMTNIYKWFSIHDVNNRYQHSQSRNTDRMHFFSCDDDRLDWLENDFLNYLSLVKQACADNDPQLPFLSKETYEAITLTTRSTVECIKYLLSSGYHYVLTRSFNSDPVESLFSALRQMNGGNDVMDVRSTVICLEKILKTGTLITSKHSNVGRADGIITSNPKHLERLKLGTVQKTFIPELPNHVLSILDMLSKEPGM